MKTAYLSIEITLSEQEYSYQGGAKYTTSLHFPIPLNTSPDAIRPMVEACVLMTLQGYSEKLQAQAEGKSDDEDSK